MLNRSIRQRVSKWLAFAALLSFGFAMAQSEPTLNQVYEAARAGRLEQAQVMMQQVLVANPNSAKAHYVQAELSARQGQFGRARESLALAEKLNPGLPFAKPEAVQALRAQLTAKGTSRSVSAPAAPSPSFPWGMALALGAGVVAIGILFLRKKAAPALGPQPTYANRDPLQRASTGPLNFATGGVGGSAVAPAEGQPAGGGLGGRVMGGLAAGLAVGAGVMAAQAIGKSLMGKDPQPTSEPVSAGDNGYAPLAGNDLGGQNFGVNDGSSWTDGNAIASSDDGGDWDS